MDLLNKKFKAEKNRLPLIYYLTELEKWERFFNENTDNKTKSKYRFVESDFYQTEQESIESFYKPISKF